MKRLATARDCRKRGRTLPRKFGGQGTSCLPQWVLPKVHSGSAFIPTQDAQVGAPTAERINETCSIRKTNMTQATARSNSSEAQAPAATQGRTSRTRRSRTVARDSTDRGRCRPGKPAGTESRPAGAGDWGAGGSDCRWVWRTFWDWGGWWLHHTANVPHALFTFSGERHLTWSTSGCRAYQGGRRTLPRLWCRVFQERGLLLVVLRAAAAQSHGRRTAR